MQKGKSTHIIKGMNKDMSAATMNSEFAFDAKNIRITPIDEGGLLVVTNEKGNIEIPIVNITRENMVIEGNILGTQVLNNYVIIFTHNEDFDRIYRLEKKEDAFEGLLLYQGNLNFNNDNPIEGLAVYENEEVQKVYWIDGRNQARVINFVVPEEKRNTWIDTSFDFIPELKLEEEITISLEYGNGSFHSGMIQYAFTYYNKYGQESNIFYTTSLIPIPTEGQASPEDIIGCYIKLVINNVDTNFDYIRTYSIHRTSLDSTPDVRLVKDTNIKDNIVDGNITIIDDGIIGSNIDATDLLYKGGETIVPETLTPKDNTLFLGNIKLSQDYIDIKEDIEINFEENQTKGLKSGEQYKIGLQGQYKNGKWSNIFCQKVVNIPEGQYPYNLSINVNQTILDTLKSYNIIKVRIMYIYPDVQSRKILAQGIITPTVFNISSRYNSTIYAQPHWKLESKYIHGTSLTTNKVSNVMDTYTDLPFSLQCLINEKNIEDGSISVIYNPDKYTSNFNIDCNVVNFYSPESEFGTLNALNLSSYKLKINGCAYFSKQIKALDIQSEKQGSNGAGFAGISYYPWRDIIDKGNSIGDIVFYMTYIWQGKHLNNLLEDKLNGSEDYTFISSILKNKKIGLLYYNPILKYSNNSILYNLQTAKLLNNTDNIELVSVLDDSRNYLNNIDIIVSSNGNYPIIYNDDGGPFESNTKFSDPISMKYKSGTNILISLGNKDSFNVLPYIKRTYNSEVYENNKYPKSKIVDLYSKQGIYYANDLYNVNQDFLDMDYYNIAKPMCYLGELINDSIIEYGDSSLWFPISNSYNILNLNNINTKSNDGDTYYQTYQCLKVYPYTLEDINSITTVIEFPCQTRVNLNGIYSKIGSYLTLSPDNFNKLNPVYNQINNFFNYRDLDNYTNITNFPNTITWTKEKQIGADVDTWTNITMASTLDLDGDKGAITSLNTFNNEIYAFQERGLSNILFNSRVQIPTSDGVPIEISNGYKVQGKRYISNSIGCNNKWSIAESPNGIYFIDSDTNSLYLFNGTINSLSDRFGLRGWLSNNNSNKKWNTVTYENFRSFYDRNNGDVYFIKDDDCLCFSELLGQFISFYDYTRVPSMFNVESDLFSIKNNKLWKHYSTDNTSIYGEDKEYYITLLSNTEPLKDKIFSNIVCRADGSGNTFFNKLEVWNEYQRGESDLTNIINKPSNLKQKFRTWRVNIPRDNTHKLDRMRNPWLYIKLIGKENNIKLYGTEVEFFM